MGIWETIKEGLGKFIAPTPPPSPQGPVSEPPMTPAPEAVRNPPVTDPNGPTYTPPEPSYTPVPPNYTPVEPSPETQASPTERMYHPPESGPPTEPNYTPPEPSYTPAEPAHPLNPDGLPPTQRSPTVSQPNPPVINNVAPDSFVEKALKFFGALPDRLPPLTAPWLFIDKKQLNQMSGQSEPTISLMLKPNEPTIPSDTSSLFEAPTEKAPDFSSLINNAELTSSTIPTMPVSNPIIPEPVFMPPSEPTAPPEYNPPPSFPPPPSEFA